MGTCWSDVEFSGAKKSQITQLLVREFLILEPDAPGHDGQICFWSPEVPGPATLAQGHTAGEWQGQTWAQGSPPLPHCVLAFMPLLLGTYR